MKIKAVIIDDEVFGCENLNFMLKEEFEDVEVLGYAHTVEDGYELVQRVKPDVVFLDIIMPPSNGFSLLKRFETLPFEVVFTTAHNNYAIDAIKYSALDYLLKPIDPDELKACLTKMQARLEHQAKNKQKMTGRIILPSVDGFIFADPINIVRVEVSGKNQLLFILKGGRKLLVNKSMSEYEDLLERYQFFRSHRAHIINLNEIVEYIPDRSGGCVVMTDNKVVPVASRRKDDFMQLFDISEG